MPEHRGDRLQPHAAVDRLGGQGVTQLVRVGADTGVASDAADDAADDVAVQRPAVVGGQPLMAADVLEVGGGPGGEQCHQLGVQRHVPVVAELAQRDAQPVGLTDAHDRAGFQVGQLTSPHAGAGEQLHHQPVAQVRTRAGSGHQLGRIPVIEELRQRLGFLRDITAEDRVAGRGIGPVPLDDPLEERAQGPQPLPVSVRRQGAAFGAGLAGQPHLVILDIVAADLGHGLDAGASQDPPGQLAQRGVGDLHAARRQEHRDLGEVTAHGGSKLGSRVGDLRPLGGRVRTGGLAAGYGQRAHRPITSCMAIRSATAAWSASISAAARRYWPASQSLVRCR
jgi:hypothetical protein